MPVIHDTAEIAATPDAVFDLIARIEEFPLYTDALKEVRRLGPDTYRWVARIRGLSLEWDSVVTERRRPTRIAWQSTRGFANSGVYALAPSPAGTTVSLSIEYRFPNPLLEKLLAPLVAPLVRRAAAEVLARVKRRVEPRKSTSPVGG